MLGKFGRSPRILATTNIIDNFGRSVPPHNQPGETEMAGTLGIAFPLTQPSPAGRGRPLGPSPSAALLGPGSGFVIGKWQMVVCNFQRQKGRTGGPRISRIGRSKREER